MAEMKHDKTIVPRPGISKLIAKQKATGHGDTHEPTPLIVSLVKSLSIWQQTCFFGAI